MKNFKKLIKEAHLGNPLGEIRSTSVSGTKSGATYSLDSDRELILKKDVKGAKIGDFINITLPKGTIIYNLPGGVFAKHKDLDDIFVGRKVRKDDKYGFSVIRSRDTLAAIEDAANLEESLNELGENQKYDDEDIVIYDGEEHIIMRRDGNMIYIRPLEDSAILGKRDEIKVPARALAYKSDLDKMYDEYKPKDEVNEEFSSTEQKMIKQIQSYKKRDSAMVNLPSKVRDFYFKNKEKIDALNENMGEWPKELTSRYSDEYKFELEKVMSDRAKYRVIDIESGELKGTPVFGKPESLMAFADDLIKPQGGTQSTNLGEDINDPVLMKARAAQMKRDAMDKKDLENKSKRISADKAIDLRYELSILDREREDILMRIEDIGVEMEQTAEPEGGPIADKLGERLMAAERELRAINSKIIDIKDDLEVFDMNESDLDEGTCGYTPDGEPRSKPAGPDLNEDEIPSYLTSNKAFEKAVNDSVSFNDFEKRVYGILGPKYFKLAKTDNPGAMKDFYDSIVSMEEAIDLDIDDAHSGDAALDRTVGKMGYNESLNKSLKEALNKRLGK